MISLVRASEAEWPVPELARDLGVVPGTLHSRVKQAQVDTGEGLTTEERELLTRKAAFFGQEESLRPRR